jgi:hypothetical protein
MNRAIAISAIALVAVMMGMSALAPAMAVPPEDPPADVPEDACDALENPANGNADRGKSKAAEKTECD